MKKVREDHGIDLPLVFIGEDKGNKNYIVNQTAEMGLKDHVYFLGFVSDEELAQLYSNALALLFLPFFGPDNIPPLEAFPLKCPVIASGVDGAREQLEDCSLMVDPCDTNAIVDAIKKIFDAKEFCAQMVERGFKKALSLTPENYAGEMLKIIDEFENFRKCWRRGH